MNFHIHKRLILVISIILGVILLGLCVALTYEYFQIAPQHIINRERLMRLRRDHIMLGPNDVGQIAPWMTFDYINHVFGLPPAYLETTLSIDDPRYPRRALFQYAQEKQMTPDAFVLTVQTAVKDYFPQAQTQ